MKYLIGLAVIFIGYDTVFPVSGYAYLDPGSMSYILQIVIAVLIGGLLAIRIFWSRIKLFFIKLFSRKKPPNQSDK